MKKLGKEKIIEMFNKSKYRDRFKLTECGDCISKKCIIFDTKCGSSFETENLSDYLSGYRELKCPVCEETKSFSEVNLNKQLEKYNFSVKFLNKDDFNNAIITHKDCGCSYHINNFRTWIRNKNCPICGKYVSFFNIEIANIKVHLKDPDFDILECATYEGPFIARHKCGYIFSQKYFKSWLTTEKLVCPICSDASKSLNLNVITEKIKNKFGDTFEIIDADEDIKSKSKFTIKSKLCNHGEFTTSWDRLKQNKHLCKFCGKKDGSRFKRLTEDNLIKRMKSDPVFFNQYKILNLNEYENINTVNLKVLCNSCGKVSIKSANDFIVYKHGCRCKQLSKSEDISENFFLRNNLYYIRHNYGLIKIKKSLEIDFQFMTNDCTLFWLELNGEFHYPGATSFKDCNSKNVFKNDAIKVQYAKDTKKNFIVIPYWEFENIDVILDDIISNRVPSNDITLIKEGQVIKELNLERFNS